MQKRIALLRRFSLLAAPSALLRGEAQSASVRDRAIWAEARASKLTIPALA